MRTRNHTPRSGFTLVELAIALAIIGLIVGGIMVGSDMIRASELRRVYTDASSYKRSIVAFKTKYNALPGDMRDATAYWGTAAGGCPSGARSGTQTCNGNNNGIIGGVASAEAYLFWQHLALSELITGSYTGLAGAGGAFHSDLDTNTPRSAVSGTGFYVSHTSGGGWLAGSFLTNSHLMIFGMPPTNGGTINPALSNTDAHAIDSKYDDGLAGIGSIVTFTNLNQPNCATTNTATTAQYNVASAVSPACTLFFKLL